MNENLLQGMKSSDTIRSIDLEMEIERNLDLERTCATMKKACSIAVGLVAVLMASAFVGCEWSGDGESGTWNGSGQTYAVMGTYAGAPMPVTGTSITYFSVMQEGSAITMFDDSGMAYTGGLGSASTNKNPAIVQFNAQGTSAAGKAVNIAGHFELYTTTANLIATWMEVGGVTRVFNYVRQ